MTALWLLLALATPPAPAAPASGPAAPASGPAAPASGPARPAPSGPAHLRLELGYLTGQRRPRAMGPGHLRLDGLRAGVDLPLMPNLWLAAGWVGARERPQAATAPADPRTGAPGAPLPPPPGGTTWDHQAGLLVGYDLRWLQLAAGLGLLRTRDGAPAPGPLRLRPAARLRLGPRHLLFLDLAHHDPSPGAPGPGHTRLGLGSGFLGAHLWLGAAWRTGQDPAAALAGRVPLDRGLHLTVSAALDPATPGDWLTLQGGLTYTFGAPAPRPADRPAPGAAPAPPPAPPRTPAPPAPPRDPMGDPL